MKKILIFGSHHTVLKVKTDEIVQGNKDFDISNTNESVSGGGYYSAFFLEQLDLPYTVAVTCGKGVYGDYAYEVAQKEGIQLIQNDGLSGCVYQVEDPSKNQTMLCVPGSEYALDKDLFAQIDREEYACAIVYTEMLASDTAEEIVAILSYLDLPIYLVFDHRTMEIHPDALGELYDLSPIVIMDKKEASELYMDEDMSLDRILDDIYADANNTVYLSDNGVGIYRYDGEDRMVIECDDAVDSNIFGIAIAVARTMQIDEKNAFAFACEVAQNTLEDIKTNKEYIKNRLTTMIVYK